MRQLGIIAFCMVTTLAEAGAAVYPRMAPIRQYEMASRTEEIALARSAGPASISDHARILCQLNRFTDCGRRYQLQAGYHFHGLRACVVRWHREEIGHERRALSS